MNMFEPARSHRGPRPLEERPAGPEHDRRRERELDPGLQPRREPAVCDRGRPASRPSRASTSGSVSASADPEAARHVAQLRVVLLAPALTRARLERHAADRAAARARPHDLRVHRAGVVAHPRYSLDRGLRVVHHRLQERLRPFAEASQAAFRAEVVKLPGVLVRAGRALRPDAHAADRVDETPPAPAGQEPGVRVLTT